MSCQLRLLALAIVTCLLPSGWSRAQDDTEPTFVQLRNGLVSFGHDEDCPGCRAFLAGYGSTSVMHSPGCSCDSAVGTGADLSAEMNADAAAGDEFQDLAAADFGAGMAYDSAASGMVGDFFGGGYMVRFDEYGLGTTEYQNLAVAGGDRRFKIADNFSPFPVDRVFFNFNHFHNALRTANSADAALQRGVLGLEKTFLSGLWSVEGRLPFISGLNENQAMDATTDANLNGSFGNVSLALKRLLFRNELWAASIGLGMIFPTGNDANLFMSGTAPLPAVSVRNETYYLQPFLGLLWTPNSQFFAQFALQADFDTRGNSVYIPATRQNRIGVIQDQTVAYLDASFGYWLFHDPTSGRLITGLAPMIEFHQTSSLTDADVVDFNADVGGGVGDVNNVTNPAGRYDVLNLTSAIRLELGGRSFLTVAAVTPLRTGDDKLFDAEFSAQYTRFY